MKTNKRTVRKLTAVVVKRVREEMDVIEDKLADLVNDIVLDVALENVNEDSVEEYSSAINKQILTCVKVTIMK